MPVLLPPVASAGASVRMFDTLLMAELYLPVVVTRTHGGPLQNGKSCERRCNTEWPRIRDIGERDLLMTMHGTFWHFPKTFQPGRSAGVAPRSTYLKFIEDFCRWDDVVATAQFEYS